MASRTRVLVIQTQLLPEANMTSNLTHGGLLFFLFFFFFSLKPERPTFEAGGQLHKRTGTFKTRWESKRWLLWWSLADKDGVQTQLPGDSLPSLNLARLFYPLGFTSGLSCQVVSLPLLWMILARASCVARLQLNCGHHRRPAIGAAPRSDSAEWVEACAYRVASRLVNAGLCVGSCSVRQRPISKVSRSANFNSAGCLDQVLVQFSRNVVKLTWQTWRLRSAGTPLKCEWRKCPYCAYSHMLAVPWLVIDGATLC